MQITPNKWTSKLVCISRFFLRLSFGVCPFVYIGAGINLPTLLLNIRFHLDIIITDYGRLFVYTFWAETSLSITAK